VNAATAAACTLTAADALAVITGPGPVTAEATTVFVTLPVTPPSEHG
jgi:hypothetical protein